MSAPLDPDERTRQACRHEFADGHHDVHSGLVALLLGGPSAFLFPTGGMPAYLRALVWNRKLTILGLMGTLALFVVLVFEGRRGVEYDRREILWKDRGQAFCAYRRQCRQTMDRVDHPESSH